VKKIIHRPLCFVARGRTLRKSCAFLSLDLLSMYNYFFFLVTENLWKSRKSPVPLSWNEAVKCVNNVSEEEEASKSLEMQILSISKCAKIFEETVTILKSDLSNKKFLVWDKDDKPGMDFVTACANIRAHIFSIPQKSRFAVKCMFLSFKFSRK
jgi:ubiquitin-like 1-activating enzyme E1 B